MKPKAAPERRDGSEGQDLPAPEPHDVIDYTPAWRPGRSRRDSLRVASGKPGFFEELKRRHVWRIAVGYAIAAWLLVQIATQVFPFFNIPNWSVRLVVVVLAIGFPAAVICAWVYEITPEEIGRAHV